MSLHLQNWKNKGSYYGVHGTTGDPHREGLGLCGPLNIKCKLGFAYAGKFLFEEIARGFQNVLKLVYSCFQQDKITELDSPDLVSPILIL